MIGGRCAGLCGNRWFPQRRTMEAESSSSISCSNASWSVVRNRVRWASVTTSTQHRAARQYQGWHRVATFWEILHTDLTNGHAVAITAQVINSDLHLSPGHKHAETFAGRVDAARRLK